MIMNQVSPQTVWLRDSAMLEELIQVQRANEKLWRWRGAGIGPARGQR